MENYVRCKIAAKKKRQQQHKKKTYKYTHDRTTDILCDEANKSAPKFK